VPEPVAAAPAVTPALAPDTAPPLPAAAPAGQPLRGIVLAVAATACLAAGDIAAKGLMAELPALQTCWLRYLVFVLVLLPQLARRGPRAALATTRPWLQFARGATMLISSLLFIAALQRLPVAEATVAGFVSPLFVTALSVLLLGEPVGPRRIAAAVVGLVGVALVVRPGSGAFQPAALLAVGAALAWAFSLVATRRIAGHDGASTTVAWSALTGFVALLPLLPANWVMPSAAEWALALAMGLASTAGHSLVVMAYRHADASVLAPFTYVQVIWAVALGFLAFGEVPDAWTLAGGAVIVGSGLYTAHRERVRQSQ
jgi:drug/metabolite transporter (DMT)-like permease